MDYSTHRVFSLLSRLTVLRAPGQEWLTPEEVTMWPHRPKIAAKIPIFPKRTGITASLLYFSCSSGDASYDGNIIFSSSFTFKVLSNKAVVIVCMDTTVSQHNRHKNNNTRNTMDSVPEIIWSTQSMLFTGCQAVLKMVSFHPPWRLRLHCTGRCKLLQVIAFLHTPSSYSATNEHLSIV